MFIKDDIYEDFYHCDSEVARNALKEQIVAENPGKYILYIDHPVYSVEFLIKDTIDGLYIGWSRLNF